MIIFFFFSSRRRHTRLVSDWSSDVCSSDLFLNQLTPADVSYNVAGAVEIEGQLDADALERSLQEIVRRHESLRTLFERSEERRVGKGGDLGGGRIIKKKEQKRERERQMRWQ